MEPDLDDTVRGVPRAPVARPESDVEDTVARGSVPPPLVEPPSADTAARIPSGAVVVAPINSIVPAAPRVVALAPPYRIVLPDGTEVAVVGRVYVGRKPSAPRIHVGPEPTLISLPSPSKELSSTHLELRIVGGALVASDMRSTNGTIVQFPGAAPRTLIRGESAVVPVGTRIDLGEGAVLGVLPPLVLAPLAVEAELS
ncbi:MAG: FHA domain-containing protein [Pseudolysinimonas sp.]|uniref:FHA domain-containing protein n=1 Tax=Pseudolysinimonas sp. TaxID=2680009 RepID=UPI003265B5FE